MWIANDGMPGTLIPIMRLGENHGRELNTPASNILEKEGRKLLGHMGIARPLPPPGGRVENFQ